MTDAQEKAKEEYLEVFGHDGEIEFMYNGSFYHIEPIEDGGNYDTYGIWKYPNKHTGEGEIIARCKPAEAVLEEKAFDGKTILEIEDEMTDCILR